MTDTHWYPNTLPSIGWAYWTDKSRPTSTGPDPARQPATDATESQDRFTRARRLSAAPHPPLTTHAMSFLRTVPALRTGLGVRPFHTTRAVAVHASRVARDAPISPTETGGFKFVAGGPVLMGTVNDATTFPSPSKAEGSYHWAFERLLSASLIPLTIAAGVTSPTAHPIVDGVLGLAILSHSYIGFQACIDDYVHERKFGSLGTLCRWLLRFGTLGAAYGIYEFNTNDIGLTEFVEKLWKA
ncbi:hypothetical protein CcaverHIS631_0508690 [Cutaneotrichosporon cavernicola]|nr:hypothetical protein CcaverHIS631_0508690 [Cutaneotrichosporon cavernicola]